jgi:hypothetical protein
MSLRVTTFPSITTSPTATAIPTATTTSATTYATKSDLSRYQPAGNYVLQSSLADMLHPFVTQSTLADYQKRGNYATVNDLMTYQSKADMSKYATVDVLSEYQPKGDYAFKSDIPHLPDFTNYALKSEVPKYDLSPYALKTEIPKFDLGPYALKSEIPKMDLTPYALKSEVPPKVDLTPYALKTDVPKVDLTPYALKTDVPKVDFTPYALKSDIPKVDFTPYALKSDVPKIDMTQYALKADIPKVDTSLFQPKGNYATADALKNYALVGDLVNYWTKKDLDLSQYTPKDEMSKYMSKTEMTPYALKTDMPILTAIDQDKTLLPTDYYSKGIGIYNDLKTRKSLVSQIGNTEFPSTGQFLCAIETIVPGKDESSGKIIQYAKCGSNSNFVRESYSPTTWNEWRRMDTYSAPIKYNLESGGGFVTAIAVDKNGILYGLDATKKNVYSRKPTDTSWTTQIVPNVPIRSLAFTNDNRMMGISDDWLILMKASADLSSNWIRMEKSGSIKDVKQGVDGFFYGVGLDGMVYKTKTLDPNSGWIQVPNSGVVSSIAFKDGIMYGVGMDYQLWRKTNTNIESAWYPMGAMGIQYITLGSDNEIWAAMLDGSVQRPLVDSADYAQFAEGVKKSTPFQADNGGNLSGMLGLNPSCGEHSAMSQMLFQRDSAGTQIQENYTCVAANDFGAIRSLNTGNQDWGGGNAIFLDRQDIKCNPGEALVSWKAASEAPNTMTFNYECAPLPGLTKCTNMYTGWNDEGGGNMVFLDRHNVACPKNSLLNRVHLVRDGNGRYRYEYTCCTR